MARRRRSYKANSDKLLSTAFNNYLVASDKRKKAEAREKAKAERENKRLAAQRSREREAERKKAEREEKKRAKEAEHVFAARQRAEEREMVARAALQGKADAVKARLSIELANRSFLIVDHILDEISEACVLADITPAKAYKTYVSPRESEIRSKMISAFVDDECKAVYLDMIQEPKYLTDVPGAVDALLNDLDGKKSELVNEIHALANSKEPITDQEARVRTLPAYSECMDLSKEVNATLRATIAENLRREQSRKDFIKHHTLDCFEEDLTELRQIAQADNLDADELESLDFYKESRERKGLYVNDLKARLEAFTASV